MSTSKTLKALKAVLDDAGVEIFGYKNINSPNDPIGWYSGGDDTAVSAEFQLLNCPYDCGGNSGFNKIKARSEKRDTMIVEFILQFLRNNPPREGEGLYIADTQWRSHPDNVSSQMLISLMLAPAGLHVKALK